MVGNRPTMTNSVVPMAKALRVSASRAMGMAATPEIDSMERSVGIWLVQKNTGMDI